MQWSQPSPPATYPTLWGGGAKALGHREGGAGLHPPNHQRGQASVEGGDHRRGSSGIKTDKGKTMYTPGYLCPCYEQAKTARIFCMMLSNFVTEEVWLLCILIYMFSWILIIVLAISLLLTIKFIVAKVWFLDLKMVSAPAGNSVAVYNFGLMSICRSYL